jgi:hypothetical protein
MRRGELLGCKWKYVDGTRILLSTSKNDEPKEIHLNGFAQNVLASIPRGAPDDLLFPAGVFKCTKRRSARDSTSAIYGRGGIG